MKFKQGVSPYYLKPELLSALVVADGVYASYGIDMVVTSLNDGKHSRGSLHYVGQAADLRIWGLTSEEQTKFVKELGAALGSNPDFDIVLEPTHIHVEYQPK